MHKSPKEKSMSLINSSSTQLHSPIHPASEESEAHSGNFLGAFRLKSSKYRGVQKLKGKATYVAHVYDNCYTPKQGRTIYLGRFEKEEDAARAHDMVSLKFWGASTQTNFPISDYEKLLKTMENMTDQEVVASIRRSSNSFSRGKSKYRGVVRHTTTGQWQARKGPGKDSFLGTFETEEEAAIAFDIASIRLKGINAMTNFDINSYNAKAIVDGQIKFPEEAEKPELIETSNSLGMGIGNRKKKRPMNHHYFLGKHKGTVLISSMESSRNSTTSLGFTHSNSSAFQSYKQTSRFESSITQEAKIPSSIFQLLSSPAVIPPYNFNSSFEDQQELKADRFGFQHSSSSCFRPYRKQ